jgi:glycosyltransferase involved in cell wall biosynthesis
VKISYIYQDEYPWDIRVSKITNSFAEAKIETHIVCRNRRGLPRSEKVSDYIYIQRLARGFGYLSRTILNFPAFFSPFWFKTILSTALRFNIDLLIVRDLPLGPTAYLVGKLIKTPVIMDMAENYPAMIKDSWTYGKMSTLDYLIRNSSLLRIMERWLLPRLHGILVVSEASRSRVKQLMNDKQTPIWVIGNTPVLDSASRLDNHPLIDILKRHNGLILVYVGGLEEGRGLDIAIRALSIVKEQLGKVVLVIVGEGSSMEMLKRLALKLGVIDNVIFAGWINQEYVPSIISEAHIGLIPHYVTEHTNTTLPNKIFDYMAQKKPVIVTNSNSLEEIVTSCKCGRVYQDRSPDQLAQVVLDLVDPNIRKEMGEAGFKAVREHYNWGVDEKNLLQAILNFSADNNDR